MNTIERGYLYGAIAAFTCSCSAAIVASDRLDAVGQHDVGLHDLAARLVGHADDGALDDVGM